MLPHRHRLVYKLNWVSLRGQVCGACQKSTRAGETLPRNTRAVNVNLKSNFAIKSDLRRTKCWRLSRASGSCMWRARLKRRSRIASSAKGGETILFLQCIAGRAETCSAQRSRALAGVLLANTRTMTVVAGDSSLCVVTLG